ncbi:MAG: sugar ABC transporter substrate-binding protein [Alphaproteobacteria bacterium]|nr:sugar ABC transporter substrate-binding protein [Alphaproteobacteria bacterium]
MQIRRIVAACLGLMLAAAPAWAADKVIRLMTTETDPKTQAALKAIIAEWEAGKPGVKVEPEFASWSDINKKLLASIAAGDPPQIVTVHDFYIFELAANGLIRPVDDVVAKIGADDFVPNIIAAYKRDGKTWGVPFSIGTNLLWYRTDLYEKHRLKAPTTWAEYEHNAKVLQEAGKVDGQQKTYGTAMSGGLNWFSEDSIHGWLWTNGATITDQAGKATIASKEAADTLAFLKRLSAYAPPGIATYAHAEMINAFASGATAHTEFGFRVLNNIERINPKLLDVAAPVLYPKGPGPAARHATHLYLKGWAILKDAKHQAETADFLAYLETGDRKIRMMHTVPLHYWPPRKSVMADPRFLQDPIMKSPAGQRSLAMINDAIATGVFALQESGTVQVKLGPLLEDRILSKAFQRVLLENRTPEDSLRIAAQSVK